MPFIKSRIVALSCLTALMLGGCNPQTVKPNENSDAVNSPDNLINLLDPEVSTEEQAFAKAESALSGGKTDRALFYYVKTLQYNKRHVKALEKIASIHNRNQHAELARNIYQEILSIENSNASANENLGLYYLENGQTAKAKELLALAVKSDNRAWKSHNGLGVIADLEHNSAAAIAHYEAAVAIEPTNPMLLNNMGYSFYLAGNPLKAKQFFNQALSFNSKYKRAIHNLALIEIKRGAFPSAVALFNRVMTPHEALNNTGYLCMVNGQYDIAEEYFRRAIDESPVYFPKAQENLNTLLTLQQSRISYQPPSQEMMAAGSEVRPIAENESGVGEPATVSSAGAP
jgi:Flp pilus assembly protein TadD